MGQTLYWCRNGCSLLYCFLSRENKTRVAKCKNYLFDVLSKIDLNGAEALFVSCTALPVLSIIDELEKKLNTTVLSSNQALIWDTLVKIDKNNSVKGFGKLFQTN